MVVIPFINQNNNSKSYSIVVNLTELMTNANYGKRQQYWTSEFQLVISIQKNISTDDNGCSAPGRFVNDELSAYIKCSHSLSFDREKLQ